MVLDRNSNQSLKSSAVTAPRSLLLEDRQVLWKTYSVKNLNVLLRTSSRSRSIVVVVVVVVVVRYWDTLLEMFYPRFEFILLQNVHSIRDCEPQRLGHIDVRPHYVSFSLCLAFVSVFSTRCHITRLLVSRLA